MRNEKQDRSNERVTRLSLRLSVDRYRQGHQLSSTSLTTCRAEQTLTRLLLIPLSLSSFLCSQAASPLNVLKRCLISTIHGFESKAMRAVYIHLRY